MLAELGPQVRPTSARLLPTSASPVDSGPSRPKSAMLGPKIAPSLSSESVHLAPLLATHSGNIPATNPAKLRAQVAQQWLGGCSESRNSGQRQPRLVALGPCSDTRSMLCCVRGWVRRHRAILHLLLQVPNFSVTLGQRCLDLRLQVAQLLRQPVGDLPPHAHHLCIQLLLQGRLLLELALQSLSFAASDAPTQRSALFPFARPLERTEKQAAMHARARARRATTRRDERAHTRPDRHRLAAHGRTQRGSSAPSSAWPHSGGRHAGAHGWHSSAGARSAARAHTHTHTWGARPPRLGIARHLVLCSAPAKTLALKLIL